MTSSRRALPGRVVSSQVQAPDGSPALKIESLAVTRGDLIAVEFESVDSPWRQGIFVATEGQLKVDGEGTRAVVLWSDTAPRPTVLKIVDTAGALIFYNIWDSGRGRRQFESQSFTSGMAPEVLPDGWIRYCCTDVGTEPNFARLVFRIRRELQQVDEVLV